MFPPQLLQQAAEILNRFRQRKIVLATAESCTGGLLAGLFTEIPGSSDVFERGFVTYSNAAKTELLGVPVEIINKHGAVSAETAMAMAGGVLKNSHADIAISTTGIAGPGGGTPEKPVGLVYIGIAVGDKVSAVRNNFSGSRNEIRLATIESAISLCQTIL